MTSEAMTTEPHRIQRKRTKGWKMPPNTVYVGRGKGRYGRWGNPFKIGSLDASEKHRVRTIEEAVEEFRLYAEKGDLPDVRALKGLNLACWCSLDQSCHADILLELANA